jgi:hypothetical protein
MRGESERDEGGEGERNQGMAPRRPGIYRVSTPLSEETETNEKWRILPFNTHGSLLQNTQQNPYRMIPNGVEGKESSVQALSNNGRLGNDECRSRGGSGCGSTFSGNEMGLGKMLVALQSRLVREREESGSELMFPATNDGGIEKNA